MENVVIQQIVLSSVHRTLHAHHFARASSQASLVLADLLSRYLSVLTSTSAQYAEHAGRTGITAVDAFAALEEMGIPVDELKQYGQSEGAEFSQSYTVKTQRREEELLELKGQFRALLTYNPACADSLTCACCSLSRRRSQP